MCVSVSCWEWDKSTLNYTGWGWGHMYVFEFTASLHICFEYSVVHTAKRCPLEANLNLVKMPGNWEKTLKSVHFITTNFEKHV